MLNMLGFARRSNELSARPAHRGHRHHNATVLHLAEKTLTTYGPLYNQFGHRETADCNTNLLNSSDSGSGSSNNGSGSGPVMNKSSRDVCSSTRGSF